MHNVAKNLVLIYLVLKPFYLFGSGGLQVADLFLLASFALICVESATNKNSRKVISKIAKEHKLFAFFVVSTIIINGLYFVIYPEVKFVLSSLYYIFNLIALVTFSFFAKDKIFLRRTGSVFKFNLLLQLMIWAMSFGRYYSPDRYMGTFNDPNQFGYYVLLSFFFIYMISFILGLKRLYIYYVLALFLIFLSGSTGMLLGMSVFSVGYAIVYIKHRLRKPYNLARSVVYAFTIASLLLLPSGLIIMNFSGETGRNSRQYDSTEQPIIERLDQKKNMADGDTGNTLWEDRVLDTVIKYPWYVLYGSGEGAFKRFVGVTNYGSEIHSTFPSIVFYYGVLPTLVLIIWVYRQLRSASLHIMIVYVSLFATSFILLNQRQALFWVLIILPSLYAFHSATTRKQPANKELHNG